MNPTRTPSLARLLVRVASVIVPSSRRDEWLEEWHGELFELARRSSEQPTRYPRRNLLLFSIGSFSHAFAELQREWSVAMIAYEIRHAVRFLTNNPAFSITAALLIALGVGANTTVFTIVNAVLLRSPSGIAAPDRLAQVGRGGTRDREFDSWSYPNYVEFRAKNAAFADLAAYSTEQTTIGRDDNVRPASVQIVSANFFRVLGASLSMGRGFADDEDRDGAPLVVIVSDGLWRRDLGSDPAAVGTSMSIRGRDFRIVGVAAAEFTGPDIGSERPELWVPISSTSIVTPGMTASAAVSPTSPFLSWLWLVGRLKPGVTAAAAQSHMRGLFKQMQVANGGDIRDDLVVAEGLGLRPDERAVAIVVCAALLAIVGAVLLVACANLAALLTARGAARESEIGVRLALGASGSRIVRQLVIETGLIALIGSAAAFAFTRWTARFVEWLMPYRLSVTMEPDVRVLAFAIAIGVATSATFGLVPAIRAARVDLLSLLRASTVGARLDRGRGRTILLVAQITVSFVLLGATGLLMRTVRAASSTDPGFRADDIYVGDIDLRSNSASPEPATPDRLAAIARRAASVPGVSAVALASSVPATGSMSHRTMWRSDGDLATTRMPAVSIVVVDTGYFHTMGIPILRGRQFDGALDPAGAQTAIVINEALARRVWPREDAVGRGVSFGGFSGPTSVVVVGVVRDSRNQSLRADPTPQAYFLLSQSPTSHSLLHVRVSGDAQTVLRAVKAAVRPLMNGAPAPVFSSVRDMLARSIGDVRLIGTLGAVFGGLALALAAGGIYGVVSYETARRRREYGVRLALGASPSRINGMVLWQTGRLGAVGVLLGSVGTAALTPVLRRWIFGISPLDPLTFASVATLLCFTTVIAALGPAIRASRSDPMSSLRAE